MTPDPTIPLSCDYLVELSDDGQQSEQLDPEVIVLPPTVPPATTAAPDQDPQR